MLKFNNLKIILKYDSDSFDYQGVLENERHLDDLVFTVHWLSCQLYYDTRLFNRQKVLDSQ